MDIWFEAFRSDWKPATVRLREDTIRLHIKPLLGKYRLSALDRTAYKLHFLNVLLTKLSPGTVRLYRRIFMIAVNAAVRDEIITKNRFSNMRLADAEPGENFLSATQLTQFLRLVDQHAPLTHYTIYHLLVYSGFRVGEALGLKWTDPDFEKGTIRIEGVGTTSE